MTDNTGSLPWYRHFWPWFVIALLAAAVTASLYTLYIASRGTDSLVVAGKGGTDVQTERNLAAQVTAMDLGLTADLIVDTETGNVRAVLTSGSLADNPTTLDLWISHPTFADRDERTVLTTAPPDANGRLTWTGTLLDVPVGKRYIVLSRADDWRLNGVWQDDPLVRLSPAGPVGDE